MKWKARVLVRDGEAVYFEDWTHTGDDIYKKGLGGKNFEDGVTFSLYEGTWYAVDYDDGEET